MKYGYARGTAEQIKSQISDLILTDVQTIFCDCGQRSQKDRTGYDERQNPLMMRVKNR